VQTFVLEWNAATIREAMLREIRRGGQLYFLHNSVESIERRAAEIRALVPEADVRIGHGQMRERELEQLMLDFYHRRFNVLMCTTIVESGIDVPTANTIIIDRADRFGLAQLHQLRGRVGRSHHRAFAYLLAPAKAALTPDAVRRLEAIESLEDLGAGFALATHDLEIRGAGELLGDEQSGQISEIGFAMYMDMLDRAIKALKSGKTPDLEAPLHAGPEVDVHAPALIPEEYMPDVHLRLVLYKRIAAAEDETALNELTGEMIDRFGDLPTPIDTLFKITRLKLAAARLGLTRIDIGPGGGLVEFGLDHKVEPATVLRLVQRESTLYRLDGPNKLRFIRKVPDAAERIKLGHALLELLAAPPPAPTPPVAAKPNASGKLRR